MGLIKSLCRRHFLDDMRHIVCQLVQAQGIKASLALADAPWIEQTHAKALSRQEARKLKHIFHTSA
jgi:hypothetical protein